MNAEQAENNFQSYLAHIRFREDRDRWPHLSEERLRERYEQLCIAGALLEKYRHKRYSSDEVMQGLPSLIAAGTKKPSDKKTATPAPQRRQFTGVRRQAPDDIRA